MPERVSAAQAPGTAETGQLRMPEHAPAAPNPSAAETGVASHA